MTATLARSQRRGITAAQRTALFIGQVWPERTSSAAGVRTADLVAALQSWDWEVAFLSSSAPNEHTELLQRQGCKTYECTPNREAQFASTLQEVQPALCIFDRFYSEEAYSFRVRNIAPGALRVLDMQDMHCLRKARQAAVQSGASILEAMTVPPAATDPELQRELASIHRSDLTLVCSPLELSLLQSLYCIPGHKLCNAPFFTEAHSQPQHESTRAHFMTIGNWKHPPNRDGVQWLCQSIWPAIRRQLPHAELHIYGAHMSGAAQQYHKPAAGVRVKGFAASLDIMQQYRVCLAPLRYGAGLKGKIMDSWAHGLPVCTTPVGAEGMFPATSQTPEGFPDTQTYRSPGSFLQLWFEAAAHQELQGQCEPWGGLWTADSADAFVQDAVRMYRAEEDWHTWQQRGFELLQNLYNKEARLRIVKDALDAALVEKEGRRKSDFVGQMLWLQQLRATEYFSRWIELKEHHASKTSSA
ncbi:hypothetical protein WJX82_003974 [Trebouxia sp. C0006]